MTKNELDTRLKELEKKVVPTKWDYVNDGVDKVMTAFRIEGTDLVGRMTREAIRIKGYREWCAVTYMTRQENRVHCVAWVLYLIENGRLEKES